MPGAVFPRKIKLTLAKEYICSSSFQHIEVQTCYMAMMIMMMIDDDANGDDDDDANDDDANDGDEEEKEQTLAFPP